VVAGAWVVAAVEVIGLHEAGLWWEATWSLGLMGRESVDRAKAALSAIFTPLKEISREKVLKRGTNHGL
jgi:hypothetical protein